MEEIEGNGNGHSESAIPDKSLFRIGEVSRVTSTKTFVLRYWETEFPMLQPVKSPKGHRLYRREDIETVFTIRRLLYDEGFTIAGARRHLRDQALGGRGTAENPRRKPCRRRLRRSTAKLCSTCATRFAPC
jgi:DNA-binding transcriptional MerR regulator